MSLTIEENLQERVYGDDPELVEQYLKIHQFNQATLNQMLLMSIELCSNATTLKLLEGHADPTTNDYLPIREAAKKNRKDLLELLLPFYKKIPLDIQLIVYSGLGQIKKIEEILNEGVNINVNEGEALIFAIKNKHIEIVKLLIQKKIALKKFSENAISTTIESKNLEIMKILLDNGADPTVNSGLLLKKAYFSNSFDIVNLFLNRNYTFSNEVLLAIYSSIGSYDQVLNLIQNGVDLHYNGDEPLKNAIFKNHLNIINLLLMNGAYIDISDNWPITHSITEKNRTLYQLLRTHGATIPPYLINQARDLENS